MGDYLLTFDTKSVVDFVDHALVLGILERYGLKKIFLTWIETLLNNQESCIINGGAITQYFGLKKGAHQGDPNSVTVALNIRRCIDVFCVIKSKKNILI